MQTWLYLSPEGLSGTDQQWPGWLWQTGGPARQAPLAELGRCLMGTPVQLVLPVELASYAQTAPWPGRGKPDAQAAGFALEDALAEHLDQLRLFVGAPDAQRRYPVWAVPEGRYQALMALLGACRIVPAGIHVDADLLPAHAAQALWLEGRWLLGGALSARMALTDDNLAAVRHRLPEDLQWQGSAGRAFDPRAFEQPDHVAVNWLPRRRAWALPAGSFTWLAASAGLLMLVGWLFVSVRSDTLLRHSAHLQQATAQFVAPAPPGSGQPPAPRLASELAYIADSLLAGGGVRAGRIEWQAGQGWQVELMADSLADLERFARSDTANEEDMTLGGMTRSGDQARALLRWPGATQ